MTTGEGSAPDSGPHWALHAPKIAIPESIRNIPARKVVIVGLLSSVGVLLFCIGLLQTSLFAVQRIDINLPAGSHLTKAEVLGMSKLRTGEAMISINEDSVQHRLEGNPWIEHAHIKSAWPHVVTVSIKERTPIALAQTTDGKFAQIGSDGMVLAVTPINPGRLPFILDVKAPSQPGGLLDAAHQDLMTVADAMPANLAPHVKQIQLVDNTLKLGLDTGTIIILGDATDMGNKLTSAAAIVSHEDAKKLAILDVRSPHLPVATPVGGVVAPAPAVTTATTSTTVAKKSKTSTTLAPTTATGIARSQATLNH